MTKITDGIAHDLRATQAKDEAAMDKHEVSTVKIMKIKPKAVFTVRAMYGSLNYYPVCDVAKKMTAMFDKYQKTPRKCLRDECIRDFIEIGFDIEERPFKELPPSDASLINSIKA